MSVTVEGVPKSIPRERLVAWLAEVGLQAEHLRELHIDRQGIRATVFALNDAGDRFARGSEVATHNVHIRIEDDWPAATSELS